MTQSDSPSLFDLPSAQPDASERSLCEQLIRADSESEVEAALRKAGYWDAIDAWSVFGANPANASVIGGQQEAAEAALVEKIVNSIDARMLDACRKDGLDPQDADKVPPSGMEAVFRWFDHGMNTSQASRAGNIAAWSPAKRDEQAEHITVAATGPVEGFASITIADSGEGQEPDSFGTTFCSLNTGNKRSMPFVQGKHTMGGTGALRFCGAGRVHAHNLQLIVSRRNPAYASTGDSTPWGFTIVRRFPARGGEKTPTYRYLAPAGRVLRFDAAELAVFPQAPQGRGRADPYARAARWGTLTKLYEYIKTTYITKSVPSGRDLPLLRKLELRMPSAMLPVKLYECRGFRHVADQRPTMVLTGIMSRLANHPTASDVLEWGGTPKTLQFRVDEQPFDVTVWTFKNPAGPWRRSDGVLFTLSGQTHAALNDAFFSRTSVDLDVLRKSLLVVVDCSAISSSHEAALMMTSRDRLAQSVFARQVQDRLAEALRNHPALRELRNERARYAGTTDEQVRRTVQEFLEACLRENPDLGRLLIDGTDISNPHKPFVAGGPELELRKFPTFFRLRRAREGHLRRDAHLGRDFHRITFETDARDDYFDRHDAPGARFLDIDAGEGSWTNAENLVEGWHLSDGTAEMRLRLPDDAQEGDIIDYKFTVADDNPETSEFVSTIELAVKPPRPSSDSDTERPAKPRPPKVDAPEIKPVREEQWNHQVPEPFDASTALRKVDSGNGRYEFRYNADNKWLRKEILRTRANDDQAETLTQQFGAINAALALAVMGAHKLSTPTEETPGSAIDPQGNGTAAVSTNDLIDWCTSAAAPVIASIHAFTAPPLTTAGAGGNK